MKGFVLALLDISKPFEVQANVPDFALEGMILQERHPVVFESCKQS